MKYRQFFEEVRKDCIEQHEEHLGDPANSPDDKADFLKAIEQAKAAKTLPELFACVNAAGWCRQDIVGFLLNRLIDDANEPGIQPLMRDMDFWDPAINMDS